MEILPISQATIDAHLAAAALVDSDYTITGILSTVVIAPIAEEVFLRGLAYTRLRRAMPPILAAVLSSLAFGVLHGDIIWFMSAFGGGLAMAWIFQRTTRLRRAMPPILAAVLSSLAFGVLHGDIIWFMSAFGGGLAMAWIFQRTGSLWAPILVHMTNNALAMLVPDMAEGWGYYALVAVSLAALAQRPCHAGAGHGRGLGLLCAGGGEPCGAGGIGDLPAKNQSQTPDSVIISHVCAEGFPDAPHQSLPL